MGVWSRPGLPKRTCNSYSSDALSVDPPCLVQNSTSRAQLARHEGIWFQGNPVSHAASCQHYIPELVAWQIWLMYPAYAHCVFWFFVICGRSGAGFPFSMCAKAQLQRGTVYATPRCVVFATPRCVHLQRPEALGGIRKPGMAQGILREVGVWFFPETLFSFFLEGKPRGRPLFEEFFSPFWHTLLRFGTCSLRFLDHNPNLN